MEIKNDTYVNDHLPFSIRYALELTFCSAFNIKKAGWDSLKKITDLGIWERQTLRLLTFSAPHYSC